MPDLSPTRVPAAVRRVPPLAVLLLATAVLYLWGLGASGWANAYYTAAVQAGSESWRAFFFGSFDAAGSVTVDKPPLALWPMALSVRLFGLSPWAVLAPQALMGVATVAVVHHGVRRATGSATAALLAGTVMALTPVAVLMFRFNNPDGLLVLLLVGAAVLTLRALDAPRAGWWLAAAGALVGLAFMTKMLQAFLVLPALAVTYLVYASAPVLRRWLHLLGAAAAVTALGSWWLVAVELWPAATRPWIGGSQRNSALELVLGYNGVGRLTGDQVGSVSTSRGWGHNTVLRLLDPGSAGQASWLLPAAALLGVLALWLTRGSREGHRARPAVVLWLTWTGVTWLVFSLMGGIFHDYYTVALAPGVASLVGLGSWVAWHHRGESVVTRTLGAAVGVTGVMALVVLWPQRSWSPWLPWVVLALVLVALWRVAHAHRRAVPVGAGFAVVAVLAGLVGPAAYSLETAATPHSGAIPHAGPPAAPEPSYVEGPAVAPRDPDGPSVGDLLTASRSSPALTRLLVRDADRYTWVAAVTGANSAAGFQLATGRSVMPLGGFNGTDPAPSFAEFRRYVAQGRIHWFISGGGRLVREEPDGEDLAVTRTGSSAAVRIERWVDRTFPARVVDGVAVHDLTVPPARRLTGR